MSNEEITQALLAPFQAAEIKILRDKAYVDARTVDQRLTEVFGVFGWSFHLGVRYTDDRGWAYREGMLRANNIPSNNYLATERHDVGSGPPEAHPSNDTSEKGAASDCRQRCAVQIGIGRYLYKLPKGAIGGDRLTEAGVRQALLNSGYTGEPDTRHWGTIGGTMAHVMSGSPSGEEVPAVPLPTVGQRTDAINGTGKAPKPFNRTLALTKIAEEEDRVAPLEIDLDGLRFETGGTSDLGKMDEAGLRAYYAEIKDILAG